VPERRPEFEEETLPPAPGVPTPGGPRAEDEEEADPKLNLIIPTIVAQFLFKKDPAGGTEYVEMTVPILDAIDFHRSLGGLARLSPTTRLVIGCVVLVGGAVIVAAQRRKVITSAREEARRVVGSESPSGHSTSEGTRADGA
jgi:hypothetical protein